MPTGGNYLYRALEQKLPEVLERRLRVLPAEEMIPTTFDLDAGAYEVVQDQVETFGEAQLMSGDADAIPLVETKVSENRYRAYMAVSGVPYGLQEEAQAALASRNGISYNIRETKINAAFRVIDERLNNVAMYGAMGSTGLVNNASVTATDSSFDPFNASTSAADLADFFLEEVGNVIETSNTVEYPSVAGVSVQLFTRLDRLTMGDSADTTVLDFILRQSNERRRRVKLEDIIPLPELGAAKLEANGVLAGGTDKDRIVIYPRDPEVLSRHAKSPELAPEDYARVVGMRKVYPVYGCGSATILNYPGAFRYVDHAKSA